MKPCFLICLFAIILSVACSSTSRRPAAFNGEAGLSRIMIRELEPYLITQNHPEHSFLINPNTGIEIHTDYFSKHLKALPAVKPGAPVKDMLYLDAMISCDAPFDFLEDREKVSHPGPSQVRFHLNDSAYRLAAPMIFPSSEVTECRLFVKLPEQPKIVYGVRLVTQPDPIE